MFVKSQHYFFIQKRQSFNKKTQNFQLQPKMLLNLSAYKTVIGDEIKLLNQLRYKLNNQLRNLKQVQHLPLLRKHIKHLFSEISVIQNYNPKQGGKINDLKAAISRSKQKITEIKERIKSQGFRVQVLIEDGKFLQVSTIIFGAISRIYSNLDIIESKIEVVSGLINKLKEDKQKKSTGITGAKTNE